MIKRGALVWFAIVLMFLLASSQAASAYASQKMLNDNFLEADGNSANSNLDNITNASYNQAILEDKKDQKLTVCSSGYHVQNNNLDLYFGETKSDQWNYKYAPNTWGDSCYLEHFAAYTDTWGSTKVSDHDFTVDRRFEESSNGKTAVLHYGDLEITREIDVPQGDAKYFSIRYTLTNTNKESSLKGTKFFEAVDYDIVNPGGDYGWYIPGNDSIWENDENYFRNGFNADRSSANHGLDYWKTELNSDWNDGELNGVNKYPNSGTADVAVAMQWNVGDLSPGQFWQITLKFRFGEQSEIYPDAGPDQIVGKNQPVVLNASKSTASEGSITSYEWDTNVDNVYDVKVSSPIYDYTGWSEIGDHIVALRVTDAKGNTGIDTTKITVIPLFTVDISSESGINRTSVGGSLNYTLKVTNRQSIADIFTLDPKGLDSNWIILNKSLFLRAGESVQLPLKITVPASANGGNFALSVSALSSNLKIKDEAKIHLNVSNEPVIFDLMPEDNSRTGSRDVLFSWKTYAKSTSKLYIKMESESSFKTLSGPDGLDHSVLANNLSRNTQYDFYVESKSSRGLSKSEIRHLYIDNGISFTKRSNSINIDRNYNQQATVSVKNTDSRPHDLLVTVSNPYKDLYLDFIGNGSEDRVLSLEPGESKDLNMIIHSQDAGQKNYSLLLNLTNLGGEAITDHALAYVNVRQPNINFSLNEIGEDPITLTKTFRVTNRGDPLTDLGIKPDDKLKDKVIVQPSLQHASLGSGESTEFSVSPIWSEDMSSIRGSLTAEAAGKTKVVNTGYACGNGRQRYEVTLDHPILNFDLKGAYCINAHHIEDLFGLPAGLKPENVEYARIGMELNAKEGQTRPYNVWIKINDHEVGTLSNTFPKGHYEFDIDPSYLNYAQAGMAANKYTLDSDIPGSYYTPLTDVRVIICVKQLKLYICANSQEQADEIAWSQPYLYKPSGSMTVKILSPEVGSKVAVGEPTIIKAMVSGENGAEKLSVVKATFNNSGEEIVLVDNGQHGDGQKDDGVYANTWTPSSEGKTEIRVTVSNCASTGSDRISVSSLTPQLIVRPAFWNAGETEGCGAIQKRFEIESTADITLYSITAPSWVKLSYFPATTIHPGEIKSFTAELDQSKKGVLNGDIVVVSNDQIKHRTIVPVSATIWDLGIVAEAAKLRNNFEAMTRSVVDDSTEMMADTGATVCADGIGELFGRVFEALSPIGSISKNPSEWDRFALFYNSFSATTSTGIEEFLPEGLSPFFYKKLWPINYHNIEAEKYIGKSIEKYDSFISELCDKLASIDKKRAIKYLKLEQNIIANRPNWGFIPVDLRPFMLSQPITAPIGTICLLDVKTKLGSLSCESLLIPKISFKNIREYFDTIYDADYWVGLFFLAVFFIILIISVVGTGGLSLALIIGIFTKILTLSTAEMYLVATLLIFGSSAGFLCGSQLIQETYNDEFVHALDQVITDVNGANFNGISDPNGPYVSRLIIKDVSLWNNSTLVMTFSNNNTNKTHITPIVVLKSLSGDNLGQVLGKPLDWLEKNGTANFNITVSGSLPGIYYASAMFLYNDTLITPPLTQSFSVKGSNSSIINTTSANRVSRLGYPLEIATYVRNNITLDHDMTLWTRLDSENGTIIAHDFEKVPGSKGMHAINISLPTEGIRDEGIYKIKSTLIDVLFPLSEYTDAVIIGNESQRYYGALIGNPAVKAGYEPNVPISLDLSVTNPGNVDLTRVHLNYSLIGSKHEGQLSPITSSTYIGNISRGASLKSHLILNSKEPLSPGLYAFNITLMNSSGAVLDRRVEPITIIGKGSVISMIATDKDYYLQSEKVNLSMDLFDDLGFNLNNTNVTVEILDPSQHKLEALDLKPNKNSTYLITFDKTSEIGTYTINTHASKIGYRSYDDISNFVVSNPSVMNCTIATSNISYRLNETIPFTVNITSESMPIDTSMIAKVIMPNNESQLIPTCRDSKGNYSGTIWNTTLPGTYKLSVETRKVYYDNARESMEFEVIYVDENKLVTTQYGNVRATVLSTTATKDAAFGIASPEDMELFSSCLNSVGKNSSAENSAPSTELVFYLNTPDGSRYLSTDPSRCHVKKICEDVWQLEWDDGSEIGSADFNDYVIRVEVVPTKQHWGFDDGFDGWERTGKVARWHGYTLRNGVKWYDQLAGEQGVVMMDACNLPRLNINASAGIKKTIKVLPEARNLSIAAIKIDHDGGVRLRIIDSSGSHTLIEETLDVREKKHLQYDISEWAGEIVTLVIESFGSGTNCSSCAFDAGKCCGEQVGIDSIEISTKPAVQSESNKYIKPTIGSLGINGSSRLELRGQVTDLGTPIFSWNNSNFAGFYYDIDQNIGTESLTFRLSNISHESATLSDVADDNGLRGAVYTTKAQPKMFWYNAWGKYNVICFMADRYFAGYSNETKFTGRFNALHEGRLRKVLIDNNDERTITQGSAMPLEEGYELRFKQIDLGRNKVYLALAKDGKEIDDRAVNLSDKVDNSSYLYKVNIGASIDVPIIAAHIGSVFASADSSLITIDGLFQLSDNSIALNVDQKFNKMSVRSIDPDTMTITMDNKDNPISLTKNMDISLMQNISIKTSDQENTSDINPLRYYIYKYINNAGRYDLRSSVADLGMNRISWNPKTFAGFYYNIDDDIGTETMTFKPTSNDVLTAILSGIEVNGSGGIIYNTKAKSKNFGFKPWGQYDIIGFLGEKYFAAYDNAITQDVLALNEDIPYLYNMSRKKNLMTVDQLSKILIDDNVERTITSSDPLKLGEGYQLAIKSTDITGTRAYVELSRNGQVVDRKVIQPSISNAKMSDKTYYYRANIRYADNVVQIAVHFKSISRSVEENLAIVDGIFQISDTPVDIKPGLQFDRMSISAVDPIEMTITMDNKDNQIILNHGKNIILAQNIFIRTSDQEDSSSEIPLRYYIYTPVDTKSP